MVRYLWNIDAMYYIVKVKSLLISYHRINLAKVAGLN